MEGIPVRDSALLNGNNSDSGSVSVLQPNVFSRFEDSNSADSSDLS